MNKCMSTMKLPGNRGVFRGGRPHTRERSREMAKGKRSATTSTAAGKLVAHFLPTISKPAEIVGCFILLAGREWSGCPENDKDKIFRCIVRRFEAVHDFGAFKSGGFQVQEMGESGEGSLEPGVASGDVFWVVYPNPFLKFYYNAYPDKLPNGHPDKPTAPTATVGSASSVAVTTTPKDGESSANMRSLWGLHSLVWVRLCGGLRIICTHTGLLVP